MRHLLLIISILSALALAVPATADTTPKLLEPCANTGGATVVSPTARFTDTVETPIGQAGFGSADAGTYIVDLAGLPEGTSAKVDMTLSWDSILGDYDLVINGTNEFKTDDPETHNFVGVPHCSTYDLETNVFFGLPIDTLTLDIRVR